MVSPLAPSVSATDLLARLMEMGREEQIGATLREYQEFRRVAGLDRTREQHVDGTAIGYQRGRWHAAVMMLYTAAGLETPTNESDLIELSHALSTNLS